MIKLIATAALATIVAAPALAADRTTHSFVRDGQSYRYNVVQKSGYKVLQGTGDTGNFRFEVRGTKVTGEAAGAPVSFEMPEAQMGQTSN